MSKRRPPWHRHWRRLRGASAEAVGAVSRHPARAGVLAIAAVLCIWLVLTKSLPFVVAESAPELALWLDPGQPVALLAQADRARAKLLKLTPMDGDAPPAPNTGAGNASRPVQTAYAAAAAVDAPSAAEQRQALRNEIRSLASRVIASAPLNARAYRLLAEVADQPDEVRRLMHEAFKRSRRESVAVFWLMNDSLARKDIADVVDKADILLRTRIELTRYVMSYLGEVAATPDGRALLVVQLTRNPDWRGHFFGALPTNVRQPAIPLQLMLALTDAGSPPSTKELAPYLNFLVSKNQIELAYNAWLQLLPPTKLASLGFLNNPGFVEDPSGLPFDWSVQRGQNAVLDFVPLKDDGQSRALRFSFSAGRARFPEIGQLLLLAPGGYRLGGAYQGVLTAKRGLRWEIRCLRASNPLAETDMIYGHAKDWQVFTLDIDVPDRADCRAQQLRLHHHARSPSEELISGEIAFRSLRLVRRER